MMLFQIYLLSFATLLGRANPTIPATFHTDLSEAALGDLRLKEGEAVEVVAKPTFDHGMLIEVRARGKSLFFQVEKVTPYGFVRPADKSLDTTVLGILTRTKTESPADTCVAKNVYESSKIFEAREACRDTRTMVEASFSFDFEGVGRIETAAVVVPK